MYANMHVYMTKVISLSDDAYDDLKALKKENESFSKVVRRITSEEKRKNLLKLAGAWKDSPEMDKIMKEIIEERHKTKERGVKL